MGCVDCCRFGWAHEGQGEAIEAAIEVRLLIVLLGSLVRLGDFLTCLGSIGGREYMVVAGSLHDLNV